jgi:hypothetical protein
VLYVEIGVLDRLDRLIRKHRLHARPCEPVDLRPLLEEFSAGYRDLPWGIEALMVRWLSGGHDFVRVVYHPALSEPGASARKRYADAHEYAHIICRHRGSMFVVWQSRGSTVAPLAFDRDIERCHEAECDRVSAYLLVPLPALKEMADLDPGEIARTLDIPRHLVDLRWQIYGKYRR